MSAQPRGSGVSRGDSPSQGAAGERLSLGAKPRDAARPWQGGGELRPGDGAQPPCQLLAESGRLAT